MFLILTGFFNVLLILMPSPKPIYWKRWFDPVRDVARAPEADDRRHAGPIEYLATHDFVMPPVGQYVYERTNGVELPGYLDDVSGRLHDKWVYHVRNGKQFVRPFTHPRDPKSDHQLAQRSCMKLVQLGWGTMPIEKVNEWKVFARSVPRYARCKERAHHLRASLPCKNTFAVYALYRKVQLVRAAMGLPVTHDAPQKKCTIFISRMEVVPAPLPGQLAFRVFHHGTVRPDMRLLVEMSPGTKSEKRKPLERELTRAGATGLDSYFPLAESGATYVLENPRHQVAPGQRFAMRVGVVTEEGVRNEPLFNDQLTGKSAAEPAQTSPTAGAKANPATSPVPASQTSVEPAPAFVLPLQLTSSHPTREEIDKLHEQFWAPIRFRNKHRAISPAWLAQQYARNQSRPLLE